MKIKALTLSFLAAVSLGACDQLPAAPAAPAREVAAAPVPVYAIKCTDAQGRIVAEGQSTEGLTNWGGTQTRVTFTDGREHQQAGGVCIAQKPGR